MIAKYIKCLLENDNIMINKVLNKMFKNKKNC